MVPIGRARCWSETVEVHGGPSALLMLVKLAAYVSWRFVPLVAQVAPPPVGGGGPGLEGDQTRHLMGSMLGAINN
eukprot:g20625.t1